MFLLNYFSGSLCYEVDRKANVFTDENQDLLPDKSDLEPALADEMDKAIADAFLTGTEDAMTQLLYLILSENVSADYQV